MSMTTVVTSSPAHTAAVVVDEGLPVVAQSGVPGGNGHTGQNSQHRRDQQGDDDAPQVDVEDPDEEPEQHGSVQDRQPGGERALCAGDPLVAAGAGLAGPVDVGVQRRPPLHQHLHRGLAAARVADLLVEDERRVVVGDGVMVAQGPRARVLAPDGAGRWWS